MNLCLKLLLLFSTLKFAIRIAKCQTEQVWPQPQMVLKYDAINYLDDKSFEISPNCPCKILGKAFIRYKMLFFLKPELKKAERYYAPMKKTTCTFLCNLIVNIKGQCEEWPYLGMDESYHLEINTPSNPCQMILESPSVWGVLRGLETVSQLIYKGEGGRFAINSHCITDFPRFSHRGVMIDTSRHFIPIHSLLENLDAMAYNKMNVFHWHVSDDFSFPYQSEFFPDISKFGSYKSDTHTYTAAEIKRLINYARERGIRVVPEFNTPSHTGSWEYGYPNLLTKQSCANCTCPVIDPSVESNYDFLKSLFCEISKVFPDLYFHVGGNDINFECWKSSQCVSNFICSKGFKSYLQLEEYYFQNLQDIVKCSNKFPMIYQDIIENKIEMDMNTIVQVIKDPCNKTVGLVTKGGYRTINSVCYQISEFKGKDWRSFYLCDPYNFDGTCQQKKMIIGGEACVWSSYVDANNLISRTWARALFVAERLWSDKNVLVTELTIPRIDHHRCKMIERGIRVEPITGPGYCDYDFI